MDKRSRILVVDDEQDMQFVMSQILTANGYEVATASSVDQGLLSYYSFRPDLIILDRLMPVKKGDELLAEIRRHDSFTPVIFLTAMTNQEDVLEGFETGANDYLKKPFSMKELLYRVKALLSLSRSNGASGQSLTVGKFTLNTVSQVLSFGEEQITLTNMEYFILKILMENKNREVMANTIINSIWNDAESYTNANVQVYICKLRKILSKDPNIKLINLRSVGYKLVELNI